MADDQPVATGRAGTMQDIYNAHVRAVYAFVYARVGNREAAEDLTADVFLKALTHLDLARPECSVVAWLFRVARHAVADYWRTAYAAQVIPLEEARAAHSVAPSPITTAHTHEQAAARARAVLSHLPENYRAVLTCRILDGLSVADTATQLGTSVGNIKVMQHRALQRAAVLRQEDCCDG